MTNSPSMDYSRITTKDIFQKLGTYKEGLTQEEAQKRLKEYGANKLPEKKKATRISLFFNQFKSALVYILLIASFVSFLLHERIDASVILAAVFINVIVGFLQENKAQKSLEALREVITLKANVIRDGREEEVDARDLVPGDVLLFQIGDKIPTDARLIETTELAINEASLTGESEPQKKHTKKLMKKSVIADQKNMVFMGTLVVSGVARAVVVATGIDTEIGKIAKLLKDTKEEETPLQKRLSSFSRTLAVMVVVIAALLVVFGLLLGYEFVHIFEIAVAVAVAAIPEGLMVGVTVILVIGMQRILKKKGLVRKLVAAETLGSTTVVCTDKTGTLTEGKMKVTKVVTWDNDCHVPTSDKEKSQASKKEGNEFFQALKIGALCNDAYIKNPEDDFTKWEVVGNLTERALLVAGRLVGLQTEDLTRVEPRQSVVPFNSENKYMFTINKSRDGFTYYIKGAPEKLIEKSGYILDGHKEVKVTDEMRKELVKKYETMSKQGLRVLAVGYKKTKTMSNKKELPENLVWTGLMGIEDPLRKEAKSTINICKEAGLQVVMITGDNKLTAQSIAKQIGMKLTLKNILEGDELEKMSDEDLQKKVRDIKVYARVSPEHKLRIVKAWQAQGEVVAMTGDGVNDAPALKKADIGVALGSGTEVAKGAANLILTDNNFRTIISAVEQGRVIFDNIKKVTLYLLSDSFSAITLIVGALLLGIPMPILATQILWVNLVTDGLPNAALAFDPMEKEVMKEKPKGLTAAIFDKEMKVLTFIISAIAGIGSLVLFYIVWKKTGDETLARTMVFSFLGVSTLFYSLSVRSMRHNIWNDNHFFANKYLLATIVGGFVLQLIAVYLSPLQKILYTTALNWAHWGIIFGGSLGVIVAIEVTKYIFISRNRK